MPDFRIVDDADEHPKLRQAGLAAVGLWSMAGARAMRDLTDGWIPQHYVLTWPNGKRNAAVLVKVGLWVPEERGGLPGYRFHDWGQVQRTAAQIHTERARGRERKAAQRSPSDGRRPPDVTAGHRADRPRDTHRDNAVTTNGRPPGVTAESRRPPFPLPPEGEGGEGSFSKQRAGVATIPPEELDDEELTRQPCGRVHSSSESCGGCGAARRMAGNQDRAAEQARREKRQRDRECPMCDVEGALLEVGRFIPVSPWTRCDHRTDHAHQVADARDEAS